MSGCSLAFSAIAPRPQRRKRRARLVREPGLSTGKHVELTDEDVVNAHGFDVHPVDEDFDPAPVGGPTRPGRTHGLVQGNSN